jgi:GNAT superfamily N-acetyltransferase
MRDVTLRRANSATEITTCYPVMVRLRPHLSSAEELVTRIMRQQEDGYRLLAAWRDAVPIGLAGYRLEENLIYGRFVYVDDLVTMDSKRGCGIGASLLDFVASEGQKSGSCRLVLDTTLDNVLAHRFYYRQRLLGGLRFSPEFSYRGGLRNSG